MMRIFRQIAIECTSTLFAREIHGLVVFSFSLSLFPFVFPFLSSLGRRRESRGVPLSLFPVIVFILHQGARHHDRGFVEVDEREEGGQFVDVYADMFSWWWWDGRRLVLVMRGVVVDGWYVYWLVAVGSYVYWYW